jgi:type 2 lantibiotic biosynthesis protein LanM
MSARDQAFLDAAAALGRRLCRDALWAGDRCNWLGDSMEFVDNNWGVVHRVIGPDFYGGTSGIALFLHVLHRLTGERLFLLTAQGAMAHAMSRRHEVPAGGRLAFYSGWTGIAYALAEFGETDRAIALIEEAARDAGDSPGLDVVSGSAGAIPALLTLARRHSAERLLPLATKLGEYLLKSARPGDGGGLSWNTLEGQSERDLTGFSHGAAGIAWALLELYAVTHQQAWRDAAEGGFAYERRWFSAEQENWPDFRKIAASAPAGPPSYGVAWCHGAPGIGLSRIRGYQILKDDELRREAEAAIRTTTRMLGIPVYGLQGDFTLCHGRGGNADLLIYAHEALGDAASRSGAEAVGRQGIDYFLRNDLPWPCGVPGGGETPNLMIGLAGIGYFYLRLYDPVTVSSVLMVKPT